MAITERYVDAAAAGGGDGTTAATSGANGAFTWAEMITDINTPRVGYRYNVKQGTYSLSSTTTLTGDGTTTSPNIIRGYTTTIGDATQGRSSGGALNAANMPTITYDATFSLNASGANNLIVEGLKFTGARSGFLVSIGTDSLAYNNIVENSSSNAAAMGISQTASSSVCINNDITLANGVAGAIGMTVTGFAQFNRIDGGGAATGLDVANNGGRSVSFNTIFDCTTGIVKTTTSAAFTCYNNTIYNCLGDGIDIVTSSTAVCMVYNNHITDCGGYGIDFNTSTCVKFLGNNRFRDCTIGNYNGDGDYGSATQWRDVTTDTGGASTDFTNAGSGDFSLIAGAPGISAATGYLIDCGASGSPVVTGGGGPLVGPGKNIR